MSLNGQYPTQPYPNSSTYQVKNPTAPQEYEQQPPAYSTYNPSNINNNREERYGDIVRKYEISKFFSDKLQTLNAFKIVFIFDDSGSMNTTLNDSPLNTGFLKATRWDELQYFAKIAIEIANIFNQDGTDVYFLNRPMARNVTNINQLTPYFLNKPNGYTPMSRVLRDVLANNQIGQLAERKLLIMLVTDGEPTDDYGKSDINTFRQVLSNRNNKTYVTIVSCTDEDETMNYLNNWDKTIPRLDVVDDYRNERSEIQRAQGQGFSFSFGDYVVKSMLGSIDPSLDKLDETSNCCSIL